MDLSVNKKIALGNGIMTTENGEQAWARCDPKRMDKGGFAARAALAMIELKQKLGAVK
jgi:6,7-dimethyl-8-ribityllumazine synthase